MYELFKEFQTHIDPSGEVELADDALERLCCAAVGSGSSGFGGWSTSMALGRWIFSGKKRVERKTQRISPPTPQERRNAWENKRTGRIRVAATSVSARLLSGKGVVSYLMLQLPDDDSLIGGVGPGIHGHSPSCKDEAWVRFPQEGPIGKPTSRFTERVVGDVADGFVVSFSLLTWSSSGQQRPTNLQGGYMCNITRELQVSSL
jgi:hypothetical protein